MGTRSLQANELGEALRQSMAWWQLAGVGEHVEDAPGAWLKEPVSTPDATAADAKPQPEPPQQPEPAPARNAYERFIAQGDAPHGPGDPGSWPTDLAGFQDWWVNAAELDEPGAYPRIAPRGPKGAEVMLVVGQPEVEDRETLLSGPQGALLAGLLRAMGVATDQTYFASAIPRHTLRPDWNALVEAGYGTLLRHHITLASPKRVLVFGSRASALLEHGSPPVENESTQVAKSPQHFQGDSANAPTLVLPDAATLLRDPATRANAWNTWLEWTRPNP